MFYQPNLSVALSHLYVHEFEMPTSFKLSDKQVDDLREVAGRVLNESKEYKRLLMDIK